MMVRNVAVLILLALVAEANEEASMSKLAERLVDRFVDRAWGARASAADNLVSRELKASPPHVKLDTTALGKQVSLATSRWTSLRLHPSTPSKVRSQSGDYARAWAGYWPPVRESTRFALPGEHAHQSLSRRSLMLMGAAGVAMAPVSSQATDNVLLSNAWEKFGGGGPNDLTFPEEFLGTWIVFAKLTKVELPLGEEFVQDMRVIDRAKKDIDFPTRYLLRFVRNKRGQVVFDRAYNVMKLAEATTGTNMMNDIQWNIDDPNILRTSLQDGRSVYFRVNQRSEDNPAPDRIETSEVAQVVFDSGKPGTQPKVKAERTFTKWKFRPIEQAGDGAAIVASQTVYDYLTSADAKYLKSRGEAVTEFTYKLQMFPASKFPDLASSVKPS